ncbi:WecB/TagA/CpsF family glycosyltransferase [Shewanella sp. DAU305]|uniref:WecB/TagA/CpsF family glycosyltransferase n=1 Tax=Shewanella sp. DAU305 TaxID=2991940 RepID=UPI002284FE51|nr:WecB/TagA/CpsF family glycosyltransferase [Shewanella sp. DAU305]WAL80255.1 WecB/TagA/CpsF family glycosyltransferase [Shewanella sp. DAU305]
MNNENVAKENILFLGSKMHACNMTDTVFAIEERIILKEFTQHCVVNVAKLINMQTDNILKESVESCDIVNIDGMGVVWGARFCGHKVPERVAGVDLFHRLLAMSSDNQFPVFLLGATDDVVSLTAKKVKEQNPDLIIAGFHNGYFWDDEQLVIDKIRNSGARLLFVAITSPKKENFINRWKEQLGVDFVMGVGGTFDVVAGKVKRAPIWMQNAGLEWLYRVMQEPGRMWKRYLITNSKYLMLLLKERFFKKT